MYEYTGVVTNVVDGDTLDIVVDLGFDIHTKKRVRLLDIDTPEIFGPNSREEFDRGVEAREFVKKAVLGKKVTLVTHKDKTGKYGRYLADIVFTREAFGEALFLVEELKKAGFDTNTT